MKRIFIGSFINSKSLSKKYPFIKKEFGGFLKGKWTPLENLHITYKFIGNSTDNQIILIKESLKTILNKEEPVHLIFKGFGVFPNFRNPKVFFLKVENEDGKLEEYNHYIQEKLSYLGYEKENKPFIPHITLKRPKYVDMEKFLPKLKKYEETIFGEQFSIEINVIQSILSPKRAKYIKI
ncbi:MAG: RNA 2',3'-cyclic phosphodiesterase [Aquificota bacterium]|nr:MAG: RNA 2',3'-cyclic phosphodiesterase [Aquificota bacterium]